MSDLLRRLVPAFLLALLVACQQRADEPVIAALTGPTSVVARDSARFQCYVWGAGPFAYSWRCTRGRFGWDDANYVRWYPPETTGRVEVSVTVTDTAGHLLADTTAVEVMAAILTFLECEGAVKGLDFRVYSDSAPGGYVLDARTSGDTGLVFMLLDDSNYLAWRAGQQFEFMVRRQAYIPSSHRDTIPRSGVYHAVFDNLAGFPTRGYSARITLTTP